MPDGVEVRLAGRTIFGAKSSKLRSRPPAGAPVLVVRCDVLFGSVTVQRPRWTMRLRRG